MRKSDISCRFGGVEFAILLPNTNLEEAFIVAEKIKHLISATPVIIPGKKSIPITASFGVSDVGETIDEILNNADQAMYNAKNKGKNLVFTYEPSQTTEHLKKTRKFKSDKSAKIRETLLH